MPCQKLVPVIMCQGPGTPTACGFCRQLPVKPVDVSAEVKKKLPKSISLDHAGTVKQKLQVTDYEWDVTFELQLTSGDPHLLVVGVNIYTHGSGVADGDRTKWRNSIQSAWSNKFRFVNTVDDKEYWNVAFDIRWRGGDWPAGKRYEVEVLPPPATELPADMSAAELKLASTLLSGAKDAKQKVSDHHINSVHMGQWGKADTQGVVHEFGHMIGCPDEYWLESCSSVGGFCMAHDASYKAEPRSNESMMNNPVGTSKIYPRNFTYVRRVFEQWNSAPMKAVYPLDRLKTVAL